jgi:hypothetical protein
MTLLIILPFDPARFQARFQRFSIRLPDGKQGRNLAKIKREKTVKSKATTPRHPGHALFL